MSTELLLGDTGQLRSHHHVLFAINLKRWCECTERFPLHGGSRVERHDNPCAELGNQVALYVKQKGYGSLGGSVGVLVYGELRLQKLRSSSLNTP